MGLTRKGKGTKLQLIVDRKGVPPALSARPPLRPGSLLHPPQVQRWIKRVKICWLTPNAQVSAMLRSGAGHISDDIVVQGSRAAGTASTTSDIDFALRVSSEQFNQIISQRFGSAMLGTAKGRTMLRALETGKIQAGEAGLSGLRRQIQGHLGIDTDLSVIEIGGAFDNGATLPIR